MQTNSTKIGSDFERKVMQILYRTDPLSISYSQGGADDGVDILVEYKLDTRVYRVDVQCKCYKNPVNVDDISSAVDWAKIHRPALLYFWVSSHLTHSAKRFLTDFSKEYNINIAYEEDVNIEYYIQELKCTDSKILNALKQKIHTLIIKKTDFVNSTKQRIQDFFEEECFLVDRENYKDKLYTSDNISFYLQGVSASGKTQLIKYICQLHYKNSRNVFWFCFNDNYSDEQNKLLLSELAEFFFAIFADDSIINYFKSYGYAITGNLLHLVKKIVDKYKPVLVFDDIHKCRNDNYNSKQLLEFLISEQLTTIYMIGWFNIFGTSFKTKNKMEIVLIDGLQTKYINQIISHNTGEENYEISKCIEQKYYGLPGYAVLVDKTTTLDSLQTNTGFIYNFINRLSFKTQVVLFSMIHAQDAIPSKVFFIKGYEKEFYNLLEKSLIVSKQNGYTIHDEYRKHLKDYELSEKIIKYIEELLIEYSKENATIIFDIIELKLKKGDIFSAYNLLNENFELLLHQQLFLPTLFEYEKIESLNNQGYDLNNIIINKIILLERLEMYEECLSYIHLFREFVKNNQYNKERLLYAYIRCLYFENKYDDILSLINTHKDFVLSMKSKEIQIHIILIVGRVLHIRNLWEAALGLYLLCFQLACSINNKKILAKIIHRIAIIESELGLNETSKETFNQLIKSGLLTAKRTSYAYYRIAKCEYRLGNYEQAKKHNSESVKIKNSFNHKRGLIYSNRLASKLALKDENHMLAICLLKEASEIAQNLNLEKEWVSVCLDEIKCNWSIDKKITDIEIEKLFLCYKIITNNILLSKFEKLKKIAQTCCVDNLFDFENKKNEMILKINEDIAFFEKEFFCMLNDENKLLFNKLKSQECISPQLLLSLGYTNNLFKNIHS